LTYNPFGIKDNAGFVFYKHVFPSGIYANGRFNITNSLGWGFKKQQNWALAMNLSTFSREKSGLKPKKR
jgi:hypothetical protein